MKKSDKDRGNGIKLKLITDRGNGIEGEVNPAEQLRLLSLAHSSHPQPVCNK